MQETESERWVGLIDKLILPFLGFLVLIVAAAAELRIRMLIDARMEAMEKSLREEIDTLMAGEIIKLRESNNAQNEDEPLDVIALERRLSRLEMKVGVFWNMILRRTANLLRNVSEE